MAGRVISGAPVSRLNGWGPRGAGIYIEPYYFYRRSTADCHEKINDLHIVVKRDLNFRFNEPWDMIMLAHDFQ